MGHDPLQLMTEMFGDPIHTYTREQALADGTLFLLPPDLTREAGFHTPIDMTTAAHAQTIRWSDLEQDTNPGVLQDETGRTWDVLTMLNHAIRGHEIRWGHRIPFEVLVVPADRNDPEPQLVQLHAVFTADDTGKPTVVLMQPHED